MTAERDAALSAIASDLQLCELGMAVTVGRLRTRYCAHHRACMAAIAELEPLDAATLAMSDDELLAELTAWHAAKRRPLRRRHAVLINPRLMSRS